ncbi:oligosaccharide flippase family protein (plasmid) [Mesorhizobium sp. AR07]|uniref:lipopolysaccharide biosynthesis protein n=1 Tax=Mesorhizobium sp. AR07 TaxID=2865838 RepID=UPI002160E9DC|nr:polysaccharide biosynthesis C-terminal domain-containing protein [Mesorhizobium sp. AR07]UVK49464.1 oligosaccharide flippase family protein [Mesorhizobium sp. AR07]
MDGQSSKFARETPLLERGRDSSAPASSINGATAIDKPGPEVIGLKTTLRPLGEPLKSEESSGGLTRRLSHASVWALFIYAGGAALTFAAQLVIARLVGVVSYGIYTYAFAWITLLSYGSTLGFHVSVLRFVPAYEATNQFPMALGFIQFGFKASVAAAFLVAIVGALIVTGSPRNLDPELATSMLIGMATLPLITIYLAGAGIVRAFGGVVSSLLPERIVRDGLVLALLGLAAFLTPWHMDATIGMWTLLVSSAVAVFITGVNVRRLWPADLSSVQPAYALQDWWPSLLPITIMTFVDILMGRTGVMLLGWSGVIKGAGIFAVGSSMAMLLTLPRVAVSTAFGPAISRLFARKDSAALQALFGRATVLSFAGGAALALPLLVFTEPLLRAFGGEFASGVQITRLLVIGQLLVAATGPQQQLMIMTGHERAAAILMSVVATLNVLGCVVGIAMYGAVGAAIVTSAMMVIWSVAQAVYVHLRLGILPGSMWRLRMRADPR